MMWMTHAAGENVFVQEGFGETRAAFPYSTCLISSIKEEVKKKHISFGRNFSCFSAHSIERDLF
jgi:hypothetical protein